MQRMVSKRRITVLVSPEEHGLFTEAAFGARLSLSEWLRRAGRERAGVVPAVVGVPGRVVGDAVVSLEKASAATAKLVRPRGKSGLCPHRVPVGVYCKRCEEGEAA